MQSLPRPRGPLSRALVQALRRPPHDPVAFPAVASTDPLRDDDFQLALYLCYELHYRGLPGVDERWEWEPGLLRARAVLEERFEEALLGVAGHPDDLEPVAPDEMDLALRAIADADDGPSLSRHLQRDGTLEQYLEFLAHRSAYQLKEADPHSFAIARLSGAPKAALVEIQADEYGGGRPERVHAELFAAMMRALGLDATYGAYVHLLPGCTLATVNLMSLFGLHRRLRGAIIGHLALFEMTSAVPSARYAAAARRLGFDEPGATTFFDEHVEADAVHENIAAVDMAGGLVRAEPALCGQVLWGARALGIVEGIWAAYLLESWSALRPSLLDPLPELALAGQGA